MAENTETSEVHWERALEPTRQRLQKSEDDARNVILETVRRLHVADFVQTVEQRGARFDVYGCYRGRLGWFVKIGESDDGLLVISHHEPVFPLTTVTGRVIAKTRAPRDAP